MTPLFELRAAQQADFEWLLDLRLRTMSEYLIASQEVLSLEEQRARVRQDFDSIRIIRRDGADVGMLKVNPAQRLYERLGFTVVEEKTFAYEMRIG